jgi:hypothetical protein
MGSRIVIGGNITRPPIANEFDGKQTFHLGQACEIAQSVAPSPSSPISSITSAHNVTHKDHAPASRSFILYLKL